MQTTRPLNEIIAAWLELTKDQPPPLGLPAEEVWRRAHELRSQLRAGNPPALSPLDEDAKDVLFALVGLVEDDTNQPPEARAADAATLYRFIARIRWEADEFGQKDELLQACKLAAGGALDSQVESPGPESPSASPEQQFQAVFEDARAAIRLTLKSTYRMTESQVQEAEQAMLAWLERYCRRGATPPNLRHVLFAACSQLAPKLAPIRPAERLNNLLEFEGDQDSESRK